MPGREKAMRGNYIFRQAWPEEIQSVFELIMERVAWMDTVGIRQWNTTKYGQRYPLDYYEMRRKQEELFVLTDSAGDILAVGALLHEDERWPEHESAFYLHHLASRVDAKGVGSIFLQMAEDYAARMGKKYMRLDSAVGNKTLEAYYTSRGYTEAGTCKDGMYEGILRQKKLQNKA